MAAYRLYLVLIIQGILNATQIAVRLAGVDRIGIMPAFARNSAIHVV